MRKFKGLLVLLGVGLFCVPVWASDFTLFGSYWNTGDFDNGVGGGLRWAPTLGGSHVDLELRGTFFNDISHESDPFEPDFEVHVIPVELGLSYNFTKDKPVNVFLGGGGGYYFLDTNEGELDDEVGYWAVVGFKFGKPTGVGFYLDVNHRWMKGTVEGVNSPGNPTFDQEVDFDLDGFGANAGVNWRW